jgi:ATP-dependent RNA helicase RhlE
MKFQNSTLRVNKFTNMSLNADLITAVQMMKINRPTDVQEQAIPTAMTGIDLIAISQTGSGKTLAFALPVLNYLTQKPQARALILAPSREMAQQIFKVIQLLVVDLDLTSCLVIGGIPSAKQISALKKNPRIIVGTPGRLNDHLLNNKLLLQNVEHVVIDEADRMLDMGFLPQLKNIQQTMRGDAQTLMFSASFNPQIEAIAQLFMKSKTVMIKSAQAEKPVTELKQRVLFIDKFAKNDRLLDELNASEGGVIVFCGNQGSCERMGQYLKEYGYSVDLIHSALSQGHRNRVLREFREGDIRIIVATDLLARGIDVPHVDHVINFDLPFQAEDFLHRIGRTARAGRTGKSVTFVTAQDGKMYEKIKPYLNNAREEKLVENFEFAKKVYADKTNRYQNKKLDTKPKFDPNRKITEKPKTKTIGKFDKVNKHAENSKLIPKDLATKTPAPRNDKYKALAAKSDGFGKPSVWKKRPAK